MNLSTQSAQLYRSLYFVGITTTNSCAWGHNIYCSVFFHLIKRVNIVIQAHRGFRNWSFWSGAVWEMDCIGKEGTRPWKVLWRSVSIYWTWLLSDSTMITSFAFVYSTLGSTPRCWADIGQWNGWWQNNHSLWCSIYIVSMSTFWVYSSTSPLTICLQSTSICAQNSCPRLGIPKLSEASLSEVHLILLHTLWTWNYLTWCSSCDTWRKNGSSW